MKTFSERSPIVIGAIGCALTAGMVVAALNYDKLPFFDDSKGYSAYFAESGGIIAGAPVQVSGFRVGEVTSVELDGPRVLIKFGVDKGVRLGDRTEAAIKTKTLLGAKILEVSPRGDGEQREAIPMDRTRPPYQLPDALGDLTTTISGLNTDQLSESLAVLADTFHDTPPDVKVAVQGVARFADTLNKRDEHLRSLLSNANKATAVLAQRSDQVVSLIADTNALLLELQGQSAALDQISGNISAVTQQLKGFIGENRETLKPAIDKLNGVLAVVDNRKVQVQQAIIGLNSYALGLGEAVSSGPFYKAYVANLLPGQFLQPAIDAAFSDLGLDPNVLLPTDRVDPQVGQKATPALPIPFPRTGQGGEPRMTIPDAITGKPGDPRYPYREPPPAPPPGGPPPGPPIPTEQIPGLPGAGPSSVPAPGEPAPAPPAPATGDPAPAEDGQ